MTREQYERWKDFAFRMVNGVVGARKRSPSRQIVRRNIAFFFECRMDDGEYARVVDWDNSKRDENGWYGLVCDQVSEMDEHWIPNYWSIVDSDREYERADERWCAPARSCIRAGLDVAVSPSAGVVGFTAGDIRAMYPEGVPEWVKAFFVPGETVALHETVCSGIFVPEFGAIDSRTFDELPDDQGVWL